MSSELKPDAEEICGYIDELKRSNWIGKSRKWWPDFLYHFTNVLNATKILENGKLLCRRALEDRGLMITDNASPEVIVQTDSRWKNYVRLYFRPRTPTQYNNEGFRPRNQLSLGSHCPVPVYFLFDSKSILSQRETLFSEGSLATNTEPFGDAQRFARIPFQLVYHDSWFSPEDGPTIIFHRHAEVIIPEELKLSHLKYIWCRSQAEYQTLLHLLSPKVKKKWKNKIGSGTKPPIYSFEIGLLLRK